MTKKEAIIKAYKMAMEDGKRHEVTSVNQDGKYEIDPANSSSGADSYFVGTKDIRRATFSLRGWVNDVLPLPKYIA